ncbi:MAG: hypothetical protein ISR83_07195 [Candidatus Marinimicrobia bacterium]|nr:hypothetical protein [Candidatus Neomarinimicrobiota bacterium]
MFKLKNLSLILFLTIFSSCVENIITIRIHPDGRSHIQFMSKGDSTDVFNQDYLHPNSPKWHSISKSTINKDGDIIWETITDGLVAANSTVAPPSSEFSLNYSINTFMSKNWFSTTYKLKATFPQLLDYNNTPLLSESLLTDKMDSIQWLPEALMDITNSALNQLYMDSLIQFPYPQDRLSNHFRNAFSHIQSEMLLDELKVDRVLFLSRILAPFKNVDSLFIIELAHAMVPLENKLENTIKLKDDQFKIRLTLPGVLQSTNATSISNDTLKWEFGLNEFLNDAYILEATSTIYSVKGLQKTITLGSIILLIGLGLLYRKKYT